MLRTCNSIKAGGFHTFLSLIFYHFPLISPPAPSLPSQLCVHTQGTPIDLRHLPLPPPRNHNNSSTVSAAHNAGLCSGASCPHSGPAKHILLVLWQIKRKKKKSSKTLQKVTSVVHDIDKIWTQICHAPKPVSVHYTAWYFHSPQPTTIFWTEDWNCHSPIKEPCGAALPKRTLCGDGKALNPSCPKPSHMGPRTWNAATVTEGFRLYFIYFTFK